MNHSSVATIISFCTNESRFIAHTIEQALCFSKQVIVVVSDHQFDGTFENQELLQSIYAAFPQCLFIEYPYIPSKISQKILKKASPSHFWHNVSRLVGFSFLEKEIEFVLFLDADEVPEGEKMKKWFLESRYEKYSAVRLSNYWYFRSEEYRALQFEDSALLVQKNKLTRKILLHRDERNGIFDLVEGLKHRHVKDRHSLPMIHHFSWVRTKEEMIQKVTSWGHKDDRDWVSCIHKEFSAPFQNKDFVHGYSYQKVEPRFQISLKDTPKFYPQGEPNFQRIQEKELLSLIEPIPLFFTIVG